MLILVMSSAAVPLFVMVTGIVLLPPTATVPNCKELEGLTDSSGATALPDKAAVKLPASVDTVITQL